MRIVVASGKGGTGKTLVATSLALVASETRRVALLDADVEAPNAALFLHPQLDQEQWVEQQVPQVNQSLCTHCGRCAEVCQYGAIASLPDKTLVFTELCHSCGSCARNCPVGAITEAPRSIGRLEAGRAGRLRFAQGTLDVGEAMATPVIRALKRYARELGWDGDDLLIIDAPPGTACPVIEALRGADVALLVTEPTPFGLHDLRLAAEVAREALGLPVGVAINKDGADHDELMAYLDEKELPVLLSIPLERRIAEAYSQGVPLVSADAAYRASFQALLERLERLARRGPA
jgi:MinD superfamily P-loop ATPase